MGQPAEKYHFDHKEEGDKWVFLLTYLSVFPLHFIVLSRNRGRPHIGQENVIAGLEFYHVYGMVDRKLHRHGISVVE